MYKCNGFSQNIVWKVREKFSVEWWGCVNDIYIIKYWLGCVFGACLSNLKCSKFMYELSAYQHVRDDAGTKHGGVYWLRVTGYVFIYGSNNTA